MGKRIVFVDDEPDLCEIYETLFNTDGVEVKAFTDCATASKYVSEHGADVMFIDYRMPEIGGIECRKLIDKNIKCYIITGELDLEVPAGFVDVIKKPLSEEQFYQIIEQVQ